MRWAANANLHSTHIRCQFQIVAKRSYCGGAKFVTGEVAVYSELLVALYSVQLVAP